MTFPLVPLGQILALDEDREEIVPGRMYPQVGVRAYGQGLFVKDAVDGAATTYRTFNRLYAGAVVLSQVKGWEGALAVCPPEMDGLYVSPEYRTFRANERVIPDYLKVLLSSSYFWTRLGTLTRGVGGRRERIRPEMFLNLDVPLPLFGDQQQLVEKIVVVSAIIREAQRLRCEADAGYEALCRSVLFSDAVGTSILTKMSGLLTLREPDVVVRADEMYHFAGIYSFGRGLFRGQRKPGSSFAYERLTRLRVNNLVYLKLGAWEGALGIVPPECEGLVVSTEFPVFEINETRVLPEVLDVYFRTPEIWPILAGNSTGTNMRRRRLNPADFLAFKMPLPPMETQVRLRHVKQRIESGRGARAEVMANLDALRASILDRAFSGAL